jgi:hypothetical protein
MSKQNTELPKWFKGQLYDKGDTVRNPFSGEEYELNNVELSMYDFIIGNQLVFEMAPHTISDGQVRDFQRGLNWFRKHNVDAYYKLLD